MVAGVVSTSLLNIAQETAFNRYGKHFQECMFYMHMMGMPLFALVGPELWAHARTWSTHWAPLPGLPVALGWPLPTLWLLVVLNVVSSQIMKVSCLKLTNLAG